MKQPRYVVDKIWAGWIVRDRQATGADAFIATFSLEITARQAAEALNRGLCEAIAPDGRWTD